MPSIIDIEGIGPVYKKKLKGVGIATTEKLLEVAGTPKGRKGLAEKAGIDETLILEWVNLADLFRMLMLVPPHELEVTLSQGGGNAEVGGTMRRGS